MNKSLKVAAGAIAGLMALVSSCTNSTVPPPVTVKDYAVITVARQHAVMNLDYPATLEGQQTVEIRPRVEGIIQQIFVDEGSIVKKGQPLFRLDQEKYVENVRSFEANIQAAQASVNAAQMEVDKVEPLVAKDIISKYSLQSAQFTLQSRQASLAQAKAAWANARTDLSYTTITSPADGIIGTIPYKIGALVGSSISEPLTTVANTKDVYAYFSLNEKDLANYSGTTKGTSAQKKISQSPDVFLILPDGTQYASGGRIETVSGLIDTQTGSARLRASFPNRQGQLRSGGTGTVRIPLTIDTAILVPQKATYEVQGKKFVYVVTADSNKVKAVEIKINPVTYQQSFVVISGLKPGDQLVIEGVGTLTDETKIKPRMVNADSVYSSVPKL